MTFEEAQQIIQQNSRKLERWEPRFGGSNSKTSSLFADRSSYMPHLPLLLFQRIDPHDKFF